MNVNLSQPEHTPAGDFLSHLYYHTDVLEVFNRDERSGFPNNGGEHTLRIRANASDIRAFFGLIEELYPEGHRRYAQSQEFLAGARAELRKKTEPMH